MTVTELELFHIGAKCFFNGFISGVVPIIIMIFILHIFDRKVK